ncbi:MAG: hypothetical protein V1735_03795 [Nanoarchaeota archaeon]
MFEKITEGNAEVMAPKEKKISAKLPVFFNPVMRLNRDFSVMALRAYGKAHFADILAGTGVRGIRLMLETGSVKSMTMNDSNPRFPGIAAKNLELNAVKAEIFNKDANLFLLESLGFDAIDIDPFGSPNPFLDAAISRIARRGLLFVTGTDTASLSGTFPKTCQRKYWGMPLRNHLMHEIGLRILIRRIQLVGADKEKALTPLFSYFRDHYFRICFLAEKGRLKADEIVKQHSLLRYDDFFLQPDPAGTIGPAWTGALHDASFLKKMLDRGEGMPGDTVAFLSLLQQEAIINPLGFLDMHVIAEKTKKDPEQIKIVLGRLREQGIPCCVSHFCPWGIAVPRKITRLPF